MVSTNSTIVYNDIPSPESNRIPLYQRPRLVKGFQGQRWPAEYTFLTSNRFFPSELPSTAPDLDALETALDLDGAPVFASRISTSSIADMNDTVKVVVVDKCSGEAGKRDAV